MQHFQEALVGKLQSDLDVASLVGVEVRELDYQATNFVFPNVRVGRPEIQQRDGTNCQYLVLFTITVNSSLPSSDECQRLFDAVMQALEEKQLVTTNVRTTDIVYRGCNAPYRSSVDSWRADVFFSTRAVKPS